MYNASKTCADCGLSVRLDQDYQCYVSKRVYGAAEAARQWECPYHCRPLQEDGELLSRHQLLLLKQNEIDRKK